MWRLLIILSLCVFGCSTYARQVTQIRQAYYANDLQSADQLVAAGLNKDRGDADVLRLERAMIELTAGRPHRAEELLRIVRDRFEQLEQASAAETTLSYWTDDQSRAYAGEDYEKVLIRAFLALSNLLQDGDDAEAYSLQVIDKQQQIIATGADRNGANPKVGYRLVALAPYLRGILREATHRDYDDAQRAFATVLNWQPEFTAGRVDLERAATGHHSQPGNGVLYVFTLTGRGPYKEEVVEAPSSAALLIAGELVSQLSDQTVPPNIAPVKVPRVVARDNLIQSVAVRIDGQPAGVTATITDVTQLAIQQHEAVFPRVVARAVTRRVLKKGVVYGAKEMAEMSKGSVPGLALDLAGVVWEATESADTRCWGLLPDKIQVLRIELPAGEHEVRLAALRTDGLESQAAAHQVVTVVDGRNTYLLAAFPAAHLVGHVLVSQP